MISNRFFFRILLLLSCSLKTVKANSSKKWIEYFLESDQLTNNYIQNKGQLKLSFFDSFSLGVFRLPLDLINRGLVNYTNFIFREEELEEYGNIQRKRLYYFFENLESNEKEEEIKRRLNVFEYLDREIFSKYQIDIIKSIAIDYSVYGSKNPIFKKNFYLLYEYLENFIYREFEHLVLEDDKNFSSSSYLIKKYITFWSLNFKLNNYLSGFLVDLLNPDLHFINSAGDTKNIINKFTSDNIRKTSFGHKDIKELVKQIKMFRDSNEIKDQLDQKIRHIDGFIPFFQRMNFTEKVNILKEERKKYEDLKLNAVEDGKIYQELFNHLKKIQENGVFIGSELIGEKYLGSTYKNTSGFFQGFSNKIKESFFSKKKVLNFTDFKREHFPDSHLFEGEIDLLKKMETDEELKKIRRITNKLFVEQGKLHLLKQKKIFLYSNLMTGVRSNLESRLEAKMGEIGNSIFVYLTSKSISVDEKFPDETLIDIKNNRLFKMFIFSVRESIMNNRPIPHGIFQVGDDNQQKVIRNFIYSIFKANEKKSIIFHVKRIINPTFLTKFLTDIKMSTEGRKKNVNFAQMSQEIFGQNVRNFKSLLEVYFLGEKYNYLSFFGKILFESIRIVNLLEKYLFNINNLTEKLVTLIEIESMEYVCGRRETHSPYSLCSLIYMELVNEMVSDALIIAYTAQLESIDSAVLSRIPFQIRFLENQKIEAYIIIVRKCLLELIGKDFIDLEGNSFEWGVWTLSNYSYNNNYDLDFIEKILLSFKKKELVGLYGDKVKVKDIINSLKLGVGKGGN